MFEIAALQSFCFRRSKNPLEQAVTMTLDPSHYTYDPHAGGEYEQVMKHVKGSGNPSFSEQALVSCSTNGANCSGGESCVAGFGCFGDMCSRYCESYSDCPEIDTAQGCVATTWNSSGDNILGVSVCARVCDPVSPQTPRSPFLACPAGFGCDTTDLWGASDCDERTGTGLTNYDCYANDNADCMPGYFCDTSNGYVCTKYCFIDDLISGCPMGTTCTSFSGSDGPYYTGASEVGYCY